jgi:uncharacterized protein YkwD
MKKYLFSLLLLIIFSHVFAQKNKAPRKIIYNDLDQAAIEKLILEKLNAHRDSLKLSVLKTDKILQSAALDQADYQLEMNKVGHNQITLYKETPFKRVAYYGGTHNHTGENCAFTGITYSIKKDTLNRIWTYEPDYEKTASDLYIAWKNSPGHYANMIRKEFTCTGIRFSITENKGAIYSTQVFSADPYVPPRYVTLPHNAYGVRDYVDAICDPIQGFSYSSNILANYIHVKDDSIFISFYDLGYFKRNIISDPNDALAIDIIERKQLPCNGPNVFHGSDVYDGIMLPPVYSYELYSRNKQKKEKHLYTYLGKIPRGITDYDLSTITIKDNSKCRYTYPSSIIDGDLPMFQMKPVFDTIQKKINPDSVNLEKEYPVSFGRNNSYFPHAAFKEITAKIDKNRKYITEIRINAYSSVEGDENINIFLQEERAKNIKEKFALLKLENVKIISTSEENWTLFYKQIKGTPFEYLEKYSKKDIKALLRNKQFLVAFNPYLDAQRTAIIHISIHGQYDENMEPAGMILAYEQALNKNDSINSWILQSKLIHAYLSGEAEINNDIFKIDIPRKKSNLPLISNLIGLQLYTDRYYLADSSYIKEINDFVKLDDTYLPMLFNSAAISALYMHNTYDSIAHPEDLKKRIMSLMDTSKYKKYQHLQPEKNLYRLLINYHLAAVRYFYKKQQYDKEDESLKEIKKYFVRADMTEEESVRMAKYFNYNHYFDWSIDLLHPWAKKETVEEETIFTFATTITIAREGFSEDEYIGFMKKAKNKNIFRFCEWIHHHFQLMRNERIKELYCESCK